MISSLIDLIGSRLESSFKHFIRGKPKSSVTGSDLVEKHSTSNPGATLTKAQFAWFALNLNSRRLWSQLEITWVSLENVSDRLRNFLLAYFVR